MKLRNKQTSEIRPAEAREDGIYLYDETTEQWYKYELDLLAKWWEYYEEPKEYWYIAELCAGLQRKQDTDNGEDRFNKQIGNYFETKEEAEKAVKKLEAWKRLKDKGFRFGGYEIIEGNIHFIIDLRPLTPDDLFPDLDLLFSQEDD